MGYVFFYFFYFLFIAFSMAILPDIIDTSEINLTIILTTLLTFSFIIPIIITLLFIVRKVNKNKKIKLNKEKNSIKDILKIDPYFDIDNFKANALKSIIQLYDALLKFDLENLAILESNELYNIHKTDIESAITNNNIDLFIITKLKNLIINDFKIDGNKQIINAQVWSCGIKINIKPKTKNITTTGMGYFSHINIEFIRSINVQTQKNKEFNLENCPNCGALIEINALGNCIYCDSFLINGEHSWVINKIEK